MSRSLDSDILAQLKAEDPKAVYHDISSILTKLPDDELLEIEFLGKSHPLQSGVNFLQDGKAVAIPKLRLVQAFFVARQILQTHLEDSSDVGGADVLPATAVLLLMDPEHLTAANVRKRVLMVGSREGIPDDTALKREKQFVDTLLTSRLHRHTKSPTLWSHRRWLLSRFMSRDLPVDAQYDIEKVVMVAGQRHPRNYTAWHHARFLLDRDPQLAATITTNVKEFCLRNHADISGWGFLSYALGKIPNEDARQRVCSSVVAEILEMTDSLRWTNESVWVFLRTAVATGLVSEHQSEAFVAINQKLCSMTPKDAPQWRILDGARRWREIYHLPTHSI